MSYQQKAAVRGAIAALGIAQDILKEGWPDECAMMRLAREDLRKAFAEDK